MSKKYYWLKLTVDFFEREEIKLIENMKNGKEYIIFYMKLLLKSVNSEGKLLFKDVIPYTDDMLATVTGTDIDVVRSAVNLFSKLDLMQKLDDGALFMLETQKMIGHETEWARKKREYREKKKVEALEDKSRTKKDIVPINEKTKKDIVLQEIEKDIDIEEDIDIDIDEERKEKVLQLSSLSFAEKITQLKKIILRATMSNEHQLNLVFRPVQYKPFIDELLINIYESDYLMGKIAGKYPNLQTFTVENQINRILAGFYKTHDKKNDNKTADVADVQYAKRDDFIEF